MVILLKYVNIDNNHTAFQPAHAVADLVIVLLFQHLALLWAPSPHQLLIEVQAQDYQLGLEAFSFPEIRSFQYKSWKH